MPADPLVVQLLFSLKHEKNNSTIILYRIFQPPTEPPYAVGIEDAQMVIAAGPSGGPLKVWHRDLSQSKPAQLLSAYSQQGYKHEAAIPLRHELSYYLAHNPRKVGVKYNFTAEQAKDILHKLPIEQQHIILQEQGAKGLAWSSAGSGKSLADLVIGWQQGTKATTVVGTSTVTAKYTYTPNPDLPEPKPLFEEKERAPTDWDDLIHD